MNTEYILDDYDRAKAYYSSEQPQYLGRLTLSQEDATQMPINLETIYDAAFETVAKEPEKAMQYAKTFGMLNIVVALNSTATKFEIDSAHGYPPAGVAEIATQATRSIMEMLSIPEVDSKTAYLLATDGEATTVEMALIQSLHMVDTAMVTNQLDGAFPLVRAITTAELLTLRGDFPEDVLLRLYGNVRNASNAPRILGSVVPSKLLELSGVTTSSLSASRFAEPLVAAINSVEREPAAFIGITTAKKPHVGHAFLLAKAIASVGSGGKVLVELNDNGPRIERALCVLAQQKDMSLDEVARAVSNGTIEFADIQKAYVNRSNGEPQSDIGKYSLEKPNTYYRELLQQLNPEGVTIKAIADSELDKFQSALTSNGAYVQLFGGSGMGLLKGEASRALVAQEKGKPTIAGILSLLSTAYALRLIDSPPPISQAERAVLKDAGLGIEQASGTGVMIDFSVASGSNGAVQSLEDFLAIMAQKELSPTLVLPAFRAMMNSAYFLPGEGGSICANFASKQAVLDAFEDALGYVAQLADPRVSDGLAVQYGPESLLYEPLQQQDIKKELAKSLLAPIFTNAGLAPKPTPLQIQLAVECLPTLQNRLSNCLLSFVARAEELECVVPKNFIEDSDRDLLNKLSSGSADVIIDLMLELESDDVIAFEKLVNTSKIPVVMQAMGYKKSDAKNFLRKLRAVKGVYTV